MGDDPIIAMLLSGEMFGVEQPTDRIMTKEVLVETFEVMAKTYNEKKDHGELYVVDISHNGRGPTLSIRRFGGIVSEIQSD